MYECEDFLQNNQNKTKTMKNRKIVKWHNVSQLNLQITTVLVLRQVRVSVSQIYVVGNRRQYKLNFLFAKLRATPAIVKSLILISDKVNSYGNSI